MTTSNEITKRPEIVHALYLTNDVWYTVGGNGVTAIEPYDEVGQSAYVPWFNVWRGQTLWLKVNAAHVRTVEYAAQEGE